MRAAIRRSPAARLASRRGAAFVEEAGWEIPASYGDDAAERAAVRDRVAIADVSARAKVDVRGRLPEALPLPAGRRHRADLAGVGHRVRRAGRRKPRCSERSNPSIGQSAMVTDATHLFAGFALAGPELPAVLERVTSWDPATLAPGEATGAPIVEVRALMIRRDLSAARPGGLRRDGVRPIRVRVALDVVAGLGGAPVGWQALRAEGWR